MKTIQLIRPVIINSLALGLKVTYKELLKKIFYNQLVPEWWSFNRNTVIADDLARQIALNYSCVLEIEDNKEPEEPSDELVQAILLIVSHGLHVENSKGGYLAKIACLFIKHHIEIQTTIVVLKKLSKISWKRRKAE